MWRRAFEQAHEPVPRFDKGVHGLRRFAGDYYSRQTRDIRKVRDHLRHASLQSTEIYKVAAQDTDDVKGWSLGVAGP